MRSGQLSIGGSSNFVHTGIFNHSAGFALHFDNIAGATIQFTSGTHNLGPSSTVLIGQGISFAGATTFINGTFQPAFFQQV